jgi:hypothetical protein
MHSAIASYIPSHNTAGAVLAAWASGHCYCAAGAFNRVT